MTDLLDGLVAVDLRTTADGPFTDDVLFVLRYADGREEVVAQSAGTIELLVHLQQLAGFDDEAFITAMSSAEDAVVPLWRPTAQ